LYIKLVTIKELYYNAWPTKSQAPSYYLLLFDFTVKVRFIYFLLVVSIFSLLHNLCEIQSCDNCEYSDYVMFWK